MQLVNQKQLLDLPCLARGVNSFGGALVAERVHGDQRQARRSCASQLSLECQRDGYASMCARQLHVCTDCCSVLSSGTRCQL